LQNFHYQTDGWLSPQSAALYDYQVESLFFGCADMMRRQILPAYGRFIRSVERRVDHLDMATGTGRFASFLLDNHPEINCTLQDLSPFYLAEAEKTVKGRFPRVKLVQAPAEKLPFDDNSFDCITCVYLFHELPADVRKQVVREMHRVLRPGGKLFFVDSVQRGDVSYSQVFQGFAGSFHEPYYLDYVETNLRELFGEAGLQVEEQGLHWLSKSVVAVKFPTAEGAAAVKVLV
jgi:ubiquinone/menaquinone biosynthesis C-methylase UbiE